MKYTEMERQFMEIKDSIREINNLVEALEDVLTFLRVKDAEAHAEKREQAVAEALDRLRREKYDLLESHDLW